MTQNETMLFYLSIAEVAFMGFIIYLEYQYFK